MSTIQIVPPTLDELEAYWEAHPTTFATTCDERSCLVGVPLREKYPGRDLGVLPNYPDNNGSIVLRTERYPYTKVVARLPEPLRAVAVDFDLLAHSDADDGLDECIDIHASECLRIVRYFKEVYA